MYRFLQALAQYGLQSTQRFFALFETMSYRLQKFIESTSTKAEKFIRVGSSPGQVHTSGDNRRFLYCVPNV